MDTGKTLPAQGLQIKTALRIGTDCFNGCLDKFGPKMAICEKLTDDAKKQSCWERLHPEFQDCVNNCSFGL